MCPLSHPDLVIFRHWLGSDMGCEAKDHQLYPPEWRGKIVAGTCDKFLKYSTDAEYLPKTKPVHPVIMS